MKTLRFIAIASFASILAASAAEFEFTGAKPKDGAVVPLLSEAKKAFLDKPRAERMALFLDAGARNELKSGGYYPETVRLEWQWTADEGSQKPLFTVEVKRSVGELPVFRADTVESSIEVDNLEIATGYEWTVHAKIGNDVVATHTGRFVTEDRAPRLLRIPGVPNVRDLGGRIGLDGRRMKQGLVYRTAGLNENARSIFKTPEEILADDTDGSIRAMLAEIEPERARWAAFRDDVGSLPLQSISWDPEWTVFRPTDEAFASEGGETMLDGMDAIPETLCGAAAEKVRADPKTGIFAYEGDDFLLAKGPAVFFKEVEATGDGFATLGCGADWWWTLRVNGRKALDFSRDGNMRGGKTASDWSLAIPVRKGRNLIAVVVRKGTVGWIWACLPAPSVPVATVCGTMVDYYAGMSNRAFRVEKEKIPGNTRLTDETRTYMLHTLGIRSDIDLRSSGECYGMEGSPLGPTVTWFHISSSGYAAMQDDGGRASFAKVFRVFLDPANYPIDFHCIAGQDRTGAVAFIVNALLGIPEEELYRDWETTGFWNPEAGFNHRDRFNYLVAGFDLWPGETIRERVEAYVLSLGFTEQDIAFLREFLLEPARTK